MKRISTFLGSLLLALCSTSIALFGEIIESNEIKTLIPFVNQNSFVFLNITGTLYAPSNTLADHQWREYFSDRVQKVVRDEEIAQQLIDKVKNQIVNHIPKKHVEEFTPRLIDHLQDQGIVVLGLTQKMIETSYATNFAEITHKHLLSLNIQLDRTLNYFHMPKSYVEQKDFAFTYGILFTNKQPVGPALIAFLQESGRQPSNVVIVDNSIDSLESAQKALESTEITFTGIRYGCADDAKKEFDPVLGIIEFFAFINQGEILSDEEALKIMPTDRSINYEAMLDEYIKQVTEIQIRNE